MVPYGGGVSPPAHLLWSLEAKEWKGASAQPGLGSASGISPQPGARELLVNARRPATCGEAR